MTPADLRRNKKMKTAIETEPMEPTNEDLVREIAWLWEAIEDLRETRRITESQEFEKELERTCKGV